MTTPNPEAPCCAICALRQDRNEYRRWALAAHADWLAACETRLQTEERVTALQAELQRVTAERDAAMQQTELSLSQASEALALLVELAGLTIDPLVASLQAQDRLARVAGLGQQEDAADD